MKIAIVANSAWYLHNFRLNLARALKEDGQEPIFISPVDAYAERLREAGFAHHPWALSAAGQHPWRELHSVRGLRRLFRAERPDAVLSFTPKGNIYSGLASKAMPVRFLPNVSGLGRSFIHPTWVTPVVTRLYRLAFRHARGVIFQNDDDRQALVRLGVVDAGRTLRVPGSGVDLRRFGPGAAPTSQRTGLEFLMVARLLWDKGVREFVEAARAVRRDHPDMRFVILGEARSSNPSAVPPEQLQAWMAEGVITHQDHVSDVLPFLQRADCVVLPSYREGVPRSLLEAAACAKPLIASDAPGCREPVRPGRNGLLCTVRSSTSLEACLRALIGMSPEERAAMGMASRALVEAEFDERIVVDRYREWLA